MKERDTAIDFVKFVALFLVLNSHMSISYVDGYKSLATGGAFGDALFFFASGFSLFLGRDMDFFNWYKRRINRIYPALIAVAIIGVTFFNRSDSFSDVFLAKRYWFIQCILLLYPLLFLAKKYVRNHFVLLCVLTPIILGIYPFVYDGVLFYGAGYYRWAVYLLFLILGAFIGKNREIIIRYSFWLAFLITLICVIVWYGIVYFFEKSFLHVISVIPLMGVAVGIYAIGKSKSITNIFHTKKVGPVLISIGALCLESYLIQKMIITDQWNNIFPFNIAFIMISVLVASFFAKMLSNFIVQLFDSQPFNLGKLFVLY